jgi:hypothetical protein
MIPIPEQFLNRSLYNYKNKTDAKSWKISGGSGFMVAVHFLAPPKTWRDQFRSMPL